MNRCNRTKLKGRKKLDEVKIPNSAVIFIFVWQLKEEFKLRTKPCPVNQDFFYCGLDISEKVSLNTVITILQTSYCNKLASKK
jgi:hypothetical protein